MVLDLVIVHGFLKSAQKVKSIVVANSDFPQRSYLTL